MFNLRAAFTITLLVFESFGAEPLHRRPIDICGYRLGLPALKAGRDSTMIGKPFLSRTRLREIEAGLKTPHKPGQYGVRLLVDEVDETPDADSPVPMLIAGEQYFVIGFSGSKVLYIKDLAKFFNGGLNRTERIRFSNRSGILYGSEIDPLSSLPVHYSLGSAVWDSHLVNYRKADGTLGTKVFAGALADHPSGRPFTVVEAESTRQRLIFEGRFVPKNDPHSTIPFQLVAQEPQSPFNLAQPVAGQWVTEGFGHGYGGAPVTLQNGELYLTRDGCVPFIYEKVIEQRAFPTSQQSQKLLPFVTVQMVACMSPDLSTVVYPPRVLWTPFKPDGTPYKAALRHTWNGSPLVEGMHIVPKLNGRPIGSMSEVTRIRNAGGKIVMDGLFSAGEYYAEYGGFAVKFDENFMNPLPMVNEAGELEDFLKPLKVLIAWGGRPVSAFVNGQEFIMIHGVLRSKIPVGVRMNVIPQGPDHWPHFNRQPLAFPVRRTLKNGREHIEIMDNTGLLEELSRYQPQQMWWGHTLP